jgi:hypothetical protein
MRSESEETPPQQVGDARASSTIDVQAKEKSGS